MSSLLSVAVLWIFSLVPYRKILKSVSLCGLLFILFLAVITRLFSLTNYPFVSVGDELRDGGLNALEIVTGKTKNIFGYGRYEAHGLIIPTITSVFYKIFGGSVLVYRLPAAIVSSIDVVLLYFLLSVLTKNKIASLMGTMVLISLPLHLFYSRTEIVVTLSSLFSTMILIALFVFFRRKIICFADYVFLGTLLGFTFGLHSGIKAMGVVILFMTIFVVCYQLVSRKFGLLKLGTNIFLLLVFVCVGYGPLLLNTTSKNFFNTKRLSLNQTSASVSVDTLSIARERYQKSLLVWITEPTNAWYPDHKPIFSLPLFSLMILGIIAAVVKRDRYLMAVLFIALVLHLTNSALTDILNGDHRLAPLYPIGALFVGIGIAFLMERVKLKPLQYIGVCGLFIFLSYQAVSFFVNQPASKKNSDIGAYLSMHTVYFLKSNQGLFNKMSSIALLVSPTNYQKLNDLAYKEKYAFFFPETTIVTKKMEAIGDNEIYIKNKGEDFFGKNAVIECRKGSYICPVGYKGNITIHY